MKINAALHTTENLGDHGREIVQVFDVLEGETVEDLMCRIFNITKDNGPTDPWGAYIIPRGSKETDHVSLRFVIEPSPTNKTESDPEGPPF